MERVRSSEFRVRRPASRLLLRTPNYELRTRRSRRGAALLIALIFLLVLIGLATAAAIFSQNSQLTAKAQLLDKQAFYIAEAGVHRGRQALTAGTWASGSTNTESFGEGAYTVTITDNGSCGAGGSGCQYTITSDAYIPNASSYAARRELIEANVPATMSNTNLSLTATASASSAASGYPASNAKDDNVESEWRASVGGNGQWLAMDHGSATTLDKIVILEANNIDGVSAVAYSDDGSSWTAVSSLSVVESPVETWTATFTSTTHRYFRATFTASSNGTKVQVDEMQDYNTATQTVTFSGTGDYTTQW